jgi:hypothetical protein
MGRLLEREYYRIGVAAEELGCSVDDMIHWAAIGRIRLGALFAVDGFNLELYNYHHDPFATVEEFTGFAYIASGYFKDLELSGKNLMFNSVKLIDGRTIFIAPFGDNNGVESRSIEQIYIHSSDLLDLLKVPISPPMEQPSQPSTSAHVSDKLAILKQTAFKFWADQNEGTRSTHPANETIEAWLMNRGYSAKQAQAATSIIRPEWARPGRKPKE